MPCVMVAWIIPLLAGWQMIVLNMSIVTFTYFPYSNKYLAPLIFPFFQRQYIIMHSENCQPCQSKRSQRLSAPRCVVFSPLLCICADFVQTNLLPLLVLKDTQCSVTRIIKLLQRSLWSLGVQRPGKCFEFFMKCTWCGMMDSAIVTESK